MERKTESVKVGDLEITFSTGALAKQAGGSVTVRYGDTVVLGTANMTKPMFDDGDFLPLLVDYEERFYAAGKIKGSRFVKREGRPSEDATLTSRLIDRSIRPLFPEGMINDVQVVLTVLSYDSENDPDVAALLAASAALMVSNAPWEGPLAAVRVGRVDGKIIINPTESQRAEGDLDIMVAGTGDRITMIEGGAQELPENEFLDCLEEAQKALGIICGAIETFAKENGVAKSEPTLMKHDEELHQRLVEMAKDTLLPKVKEAKTKQDFRNAESDTVEAVKAKLSEEELEEISERQIKHAIHTLRGEHARDEAFNGWREMGRGLDQIRDLHVESGLLPRTHGSGLFQRGETQVLSVATLGGPGDQQILDTMEVDEKKRYMHFYNFPGFSVGENKPSRGPGRREIGHGALAERALVPVLPNHEDWPYTMLVVSEILESNGSSSMGSVCGSTLALMDAGVPLKKPVSGIAMGLFSKEKEDGTIEDYRVLTDIAGIEDEKGDMDFKIAGTADGITSVQMDIKVKGLRRDILEAALEQAKKARLEILDKMLQLLPEPKEMSPYAPRIETMRVPVEKIGDLIGPKGKHINEIIEQTGVEIDIEDDGLVSIMSTDGTAMQKAKDWVTSMTKEIEVGESFEGKVTKILNFGAFVELTPNTEGMVHISQFSKERVNDIHDVVKVGDIISVIVTEIDSMGRINASHLATKDPEAAKQAEEKQKQGRRSGGAGKPGGFRGPRPPR